jgi:hypothetical protein
MNKALMNKCLLGLLVVTILVSGGYWFASRSSSPAALEAETTIGKPVMDTRTPSWTSSTQSTLALGSDETILTAGFFHASPGQEFSFALNVQWQTSITTESQLEAKQSHGWGVDTSELMEETEAYMQLQATMRVAVFDSTMSAYVLRFILDHPRLTGAVGGQQHSAPPLAALDRPVVVRFQKDGRVLGYSFEPDTSPEIKRLLAAIIANSHQFLVRQDTETVSGLRDEIGAFTAQFTWEPPQDGVLTSPAVRRRLVLSYDQLGDEQTSKSVRVVQSASLAHFRNGWITRAQVQEAREAQFHGIQLGSRLVLQIEYQGVTTVTLDPTAFHVVRWEFPSADEGGVTESKAESKLSDPDKVRRRTAEIVATLDALIRAGQYDQEAAFEAWASLAELVSQAPALVLPQLEELLHSGTLDPTTERYAISAIGKAGSGGTAEAVETLHNFLTDPTASAERRLSIIVASHQLGPYAGLIRDDLLHALQQSESGGEGESLSSAAALALGSLAGASGDEGQLRTALDTIQEWAFTQGQPTVYFDALANSGNPEIIAKAFPYVNDTNADVRQGALEALSKLENDPRAVRTLSEKAQEAGETAGVRRVAIDGLGEFPNNSEAVQTLIQLTDWETDEALRTEALLALGQMAHTGVKEALPAIRRAIADPNPSISTLAEQLLKEL